MSTLDLDIMCGTSLNGIDLSFFAFPGVLTFNGRTNVLSSVTGAAHDPTGAIIYRVENK